MARNIAIKSKTDKLWVFWIAKADRIEIVTSYFFGRVPEKSKARKINFELRKPSDVISSGYTNDPIDFQYFIWPDNIKKPDCLLKKDS